MASTRFYAHISLSIRLVVLLCGFHDIDPDSSQIIASVVGVIAFLIFGAFETWYATGFDHMPTFIRQIGGGTFSGCAGIPGCETGFLVKGWAGAAVLPIHLYICNRKLF
uniref:Uncharacterized protein n=1 Tax=Meloidogyne javanica TaxID=6303 RepID=A0A915N9N2_MELJA